MEMRNLYWLWSLTCILILSLLYLSAECRRYEKCYTHGGRQGVCVVKRYCRETSVGSLQSCDAGDTYCCPLPKSATSSPDIPPFDKTQIEEEPEREARPEKSRGIETEDDNPKRHREPSVERPVDGHRQRVRQDGRARDKVATESGQDRGSGFGNDRTRGGHRDESDSRKKFNEENSPELRPSHSLNPKWNEEGTPFNREPIQRPTRNSTRSFSIPRGPIRFPEEHERPVQQPKVPVQQPKVSVQQPKVPVQQPKVSVQQPKVPECGVKPYNLFIAGGDEAKPHEWPWMTAIFRRYQGSKPKTFLCGGSLVSTRYILTAAHCFVHNYVVLPASSFVVRLGSHNLDSGEEYTVSNIAIHTNHSGADFFNDIALVRLASEVYVTDKIAPICLPFSDMLRDNLVDRLATVAGWGDTAFRTGGSRILQNVEVPIVSSEDCFTAYSRVKGAAFLAKGSDHVVCAGLREGGKDACLGDSGGPLMMKTGDRWVVIGIVSLGYKCAEPGYPGVYTRVTHYMSWLRSKMKNRY